jgi:hypothetical protein
MASGALWFYGSVGNRVGRVAPGGSLKALKVLTACSGPSE